MNPLKSVACLSALFESGAEATRLQSTNIRFIA